MLTLGDKQEFEARIWSSACTRVLSNDALLQHQCCCLGSSHGFFLGQSQSLMPVFLLYYYTGMAFPCRRKQQS
ncbi:hypothetical protein BDL97_19G003500 [Sphagnum fallax]|nr:hypothetical protein BDL97_19G003500 [Sphagnum fallax]